MSQPNEVNSLFRNTLDQYGLVSKFLHWSLVLLVFIMFFLIFWVHYLLPKKHPLGNFLIGGLHKPLGMVIFVLALFALFWRLINIKPLFPERMNRLERFIAKTVHFLLYFCLLIMPISGLIMSVAAGYPPNFFGLFQVPQFMEKNKMVADYFFEVHEITAWVFGILIILHIAAALQHHFIYKDNVLKRMLK